MSASLSELSAAATPGLWAVCEYLRPDGSSHVNTGERHWTILQAHPHKGCTDPSLDISGPEAAANAALACRLVNEFRAGRLVEASPALPTAPVSGAQEGG